MGNPDGSSCRSGSECNSNCCYNFLCEAYAYCGGAATLWWVYVIWVAVSIISCVVCVIIIVCIVRACNR